MAVAIRACDLAAILPSRDGGRPATALAAGGHRQVSDPAPAALQVELLRRVLGLREVVLSIGSCGAALTLELGAHSGGAARQFAHLHVVGAGCVHLRLPGEMVEAVDGQGWGERTPQSPDVLVFAARTTDELEIVWSLVLAAYRFAYETGS